MGGLSQQDRERIRAEAQTEVVVELRLSREMERLRDGNRLRRRFLDETMATASRIAIIAARGRP